MDIVLEDLNSAWTLDGNELRREFLFKGFNKVISFTNAVAWIANKQNHHPDMHLSYKTCTIKLTTHDEGNHVGHKDFALAYEIDKLFIE